MDKISANDRIEYLEFLKRNVNNMKFPPDFNEDFSYYQDAIVHHITNCYFYAMQFRLNDIIFNKVDKTYLPLEYCTPDFFSPDFVKTPEMKDDYQVVTDVVSDFKFSPGFMSGETLEYYKDKNEIMERVYSDLELLDLSHHCSDIYSPTIYGGYKIIVMINELGRDYHFIRQNKDFTLSEKLKYGGRVHITTSFLDDDYINELYEIVEIIEIHKPKIIILK